jgi:hypothetical protein
VPARVPAHLHRGAGRRDLPGVRVGLVEAEQGVLHALHQQGRRVIEPVTEAGEERASRAAVAGERRPVVAASV